MQFNRIGQHLYANTTPEELSWMFTVEYTYEVFRGQPAQQGLTGTVKASSCMLAIEAAKKQFVYLSGVTVDHIAALEIKVMENQA